MYPGYTRRWIITLLLAGLLIVAPGRALAGHPHTGELWRDTDLPTLEPLTVGKPISRIVCPEGFEAFVYAVDLESPGGLAFDPGGVLHVAEENAGRVSRIDSDGTVTTVVARLDYPEGIAFDPAGNLYVVEDVKNGRLLRIDPQGQQTVLATGLDAPEGVVWAPDSDLFVTESNVQFVENLPWDVISGVTRVSQGLEVTEVFSDTLLWSYSAITLDPDGLLYVANEASNVATTDSIFQVDPATGQRTLFASDLTAVEGLHFSPGGRFPLYATEEDLGDGMGRLNLVEASGAHKALCTGFRGPEGVAVDRNGNLYVTDHTMIVQVVAPDLVPPDPPQQPAADPPSWTATNRFSLSWQNPVDTSGIAGAYLKMDEPPIGVADGAFYAGAAMSQIAGITVANPGAQTAYLWLEDGAGNADYTSAVSITLHYDPDPPGSPIDLIAEPGSWSPANRFALSWTNPTEVSGMLTACYSLDAPPLSVEDHSGCQAGVDIQGLSNVTVPDSGEHRAYVWLGDAAGNVDPATAISTTLRLDTIPPASLTNAPASTKIAPIRVTWVATDTLSGMESVALWVRKGDEGTWMDSGQAHQIGGAAVPGTASQGVFLFQPTGPAAYYFGTRAVDQAGNTEAEPTGDGDTKTDCQTWQRAYLPLLWKNSP